MAGLGFLVKARGRSHLVPRKVTVKKPGGGTYQAIRYVRATAGEAGKKTGAGKPEKKATEREWFTGYPDNLKDFTDEDKEKYAGEMADYWSKPERHGTLEDHLASAEEALELASPRERAETEISVGITRRALEIYKERYGEKAGTAKPKGEGEPAVEKPDKFDFSGLPKHATDFTDEDIDRIFDFYMTRKKKELKEHREVFGDQLEIAMKEKDQRSVDDLSIKRRIVSSAIIEKVNPGRGREGLPEGKEPEDEKVEKGVTVIPFAKACGAAAIKYRKPRKGYPKSKKMYADPKRFKYRLDTKKNAKSALSYFSMPKNIKGYPVKERKQILRRIVGACEGYGVVVSDDVRVRAGLKTKKKKKGKK